MRRSRIMVLKCRNHPDRDVAYLKVLARKRSEDYFGVDLTTQRTYLCQECGEKAYRRRFGLLKGEIGECYSLDEAKRALLKAVYGAWDDDQSLPSDKDLRKAFEGFTTNQMRVLQLRFGFEGKFLTLEKIGTEIGLTRERIRQIESAGIRKLRHPLRRFLLAGGVEK